MLDLLLASESARTTTALTRLQDAGSNLHDNAVQTAALSSNEAALLEQQSTETSRAAAAVKRYLPVAVHFGANNFIIAARCYF